MTSKQDFLGSVRIKPVLQETVKTMCGGMMAVSSAILFFWMQSEKPLTPVAFVMLMALVIAIPLLAAARVLHGIFDQYERVDAEIEERLTNLFTAGTGLSFMGYCYSIYVYNIFLCIAFVVSVGLTFYQLVKLSKAMDSPHNVKLQ